MSQLQQNHLLRIVTFNIWFDQRCLVSRTRHIATVVLPRTCADVICLQEVTQVSFRILSQALCEVYDFSPVPHGASYFTAVLARKSLRPQFMTMRLPTEMGRKLLVAFLWPSASGSCPKDESVAVRAGELLVGTESSSAALQPEVVVATSHFESLGSRPLRKQQLQVAASLLKHHERWVLCGDFNFCSYRNYHGRQPHNLENTVLSEVLPPHHDAWLTLHPRAYEDEAERGYTFDSCANSNIRQAEQMRYDRVLVSPSLRPVSMELLGTEPLPSAPSGPSAPRARMVKSDVLEHHCVEGMIGSSEDDFDDDDEDVVWLSLLPQRPTKGDKEGVLSVEVGGAAAAVAPAASPDGNALPVSAAVAPLNSSENCMVTPIRATVFPDATPAFLDGSQAPPIQPQAPVFQTPIRVPEVYPSDHFGLLCVVEF